MECRRCSTCCVAPDISSLGKRVGARCVHLGPSGLCEAYDERPQVCRSYRPDSLCLQIEAPTLGERVEKYLALFGVERNQEEG